MKWGPTVLQRETVVRAPIVRHLVCLHMVAGELVKEMFWVKLTNDSLLVDLLDVLRASRAIRVPDLEVDGVHSAFPRGDGICQAGRARCPRSVVSVVVVVVVGCG